MTAGTAYADALAGSARPFAEGVTPAAHGLVDHAGERHLALAHFVAGEPRGEEPAVPEDLGEVVIHGWLLAVRSGERIDLGLVAAGAALSVWSCSTNARAFSTCEAGRSLMRCTPNF
jgi:hypothetical protein